jgi:hypothetical protein
MSNPNYLEGLRERLVADLTEAAYPVALRHGPHSPSVDVELGVWKAIDRALPRGRRWERLLESGHDAERAEVLAAVSDAAYRAALHHGTTAPFPDLELGLWHALEGTRLTGRNHP